MTRRIFDLFFSITGLILLFPLFLVISFLILTDSKGSAFYIQRRVGKNQREFDLIKFRSMKSGAEITGLLTIGENDSRITKTGRWLRKYKLDELPQLWNILKGDMSFVGPRPEVKKYVDLYTPEQKKVLSVKPGLTDYASIKYINENTLLTTYSDPEKAYVEIIMPAKLILNLKYIYERTLIKDVKVIIQTINKIMQ